MDWNPNPKMLSAKKELLNAICPELKCRNCDGIPRPGETLWYQCLKGHFTCLKCRKGSPKKIVIGLPSINRVCKCGAIMSSRSDEIVGKLISTLPFQCLFSKNGCDIVLFAEDVPDHEKNCRFRDLNCFICQETVPLISFEDHMESAHQDLKSNFTQVSMNTYKCRDNCASDTENLQIWAKLEGENGEIFYEIGVQHEELLHRWVYFFGTPEQAEEYCFFVHLNANKGEVLTYQGPVRSVDESFEDILENQGTFNVGIKTGKRLFISQNMEYTLTIRKLVTNSQNREPVREEPDGYTTTDQESVDFEIQEDVTSTSTVELTLPRINV